MKQAIRLVFIPSNLRCITESLTHMNIRPISLGTHMMKCSAIVHCDALPPSFKNHDELPHCLVAGPRKSLVKKEKGVLSDPLSGFAIEFRIKSAGLPFFSDQDGVMTRSSHDSDSTRSNPS